MKGSPCLCLCKTFGQLTACKLFPNMKTVANWDRNHGRIPKYFWDADIRACHICTIWAMLPGESGYLTHLGKPSHVIDSLVAMDPSWLTR